MFSQEVLLGRELCHLKINSLYRYTEVKNIAILRTIKKGKNTTSNKTMKLNKDIPDQTIVQFTTSNETIRRR